MLMIKKLGVTDTNAAPTVTLQLTVTINNKNLVQKVQDYLVTTTPSGSISSQATFSDSKQKSLESSARDKATVDARAKADQMAKNLGFSVGRVKSVADGDQGRVMPMISSGATLSADSTAPKAQLSVQPGENVLNYSVTVVYYIR